jgi:hypothetical protein
MEVVRTAFKIHLRKGEPSPLKTTKSRDFLPVIFNRLGYKMGAEIGVAEGKYSELICKNNPGVRHFAIDPWRVYEGSFRSVQVGQKRVEQRFEEAKKRLCPFGAELMPLFSVEATGRFKVGELDYVYIDGNHEFDYVMEDLIRWSRKVRIGGIIAGHDYYVFRKAGVMTAVNAYTAAHNIKEWYVTKDREPSFFWVKQHE